jgi:hypothetical protein
LAAAFPNIQGGRNTWNTFNVDGVRGNDLGSPNVFSSTVNFDAIGEVKVLLNGYQAEYASNSSANVNIITKSGSSQYHGGGYWYRRHEQFNANSWQNNNTLHHLAADGQDLPQCRSRATATARSARPLAGRSGCRSWATRSKTNCSSSTRSRIRRP